MINSRNLRLPAIGCALAVLGCELVSRPWAEMSVADDWSYVRSAQRLAETGHLFYNGWANAMLGWQLYLAAGLIRLFGFSFATVRLSTLLTSMAAAFLLQRAMARAGITERNATFGTLTVALSPLYLTLTASFMSDIGGFFAVVVCLYGCLRALTATTSRRALLWICFATAANALCGSSRQIAWLGVLVMVPSTLWLLRKDRRVFAGGAFAAVVGGLFILGCMHWFLSQPYSLPESLKGDPRAHTPLLRMLLTYVSKAGRELPFLVLPLMMLFPPAIWRRGRGVAAAAAACTAGYLLYAWRVWTHPALPVQHADAALEPIIGDWVGPHLRTEYFRIFGEGPIVLHTGVRFLLTAVSIGGLICLLAFLLTLRKQPGNLPPAGTPSWKSLGFLLVPFVTIYSLLLVHRWLEDRYLLPLAAVAALCLTRLYQDRAQAAIPTGMAFLLAASAIFGISATHNIFAFDRARIAAVQSLEAAGVPETAIDAGSEYSGWTELKYADHVNDPRILIPANAYVPVPLTGRCPRDFGAVQDEQLFPHVVPKYDLSFDPKACGGLAPFAPVTYTTWPIMKETPVYIVRERPGND